LNKELFDKNVRIMKKGENEYTLFYADDDASYDTNIDIIGEIDRLTDEFIVSVINGEISFFAATELKRLRKKAKNILKCQAKNDLRQEGKGDLKWQKKSRKKGERN
jgi:hypothetical protein